MSRLRTFRTCLGGQHSRAATLTKLQRISHRLDPLPSQCGCIRRLGTHRTSKQVVENLSLAPNAEGASTVLPSLLGPTLLVGGAEVSTATISSKWVALYFVAHWCPPCRASTPRLKEFYEKFKDSHEHAADFDVVFVSWDRNEEQFEAYVAEMPWGALPYKNRDAQAKLSKRFKVTTIPTLLILDAKTGSVVTSNAIRKVETDPEGRDFPWAPPALSTLLAGPLTSASGATTDFAEAMAGKITGIYFSAHWCPPCRAFTPQLAEFYKSAQAAGKPFEVVFISSDRDETSFNEYLSEMPWCAVPYTDTARRSALSEHFKIQGIPSLVILTEGAGTVITTEGTSCLRSDPTGVDFPWAPRPVEKLSALAVPRLNDGETCFIYFTNDFTPAGVERAEELLIDAALPEFTKAEEPKAVFYVADSAFRLATSILSMFGLSRAPMPQLVMASLPQYAVAAEVKSAADIQAFVSSCLKGEADLKSLE